MSLKVVAGMWIKKSIFTGNITFTSSNIAPPVYNIGGLAPPVPTALEKFCRSKH